MNVRESHRTRHLVIRLDRGDELPAALVRALDEAEARSGFITGVGTLEAAVLRQADQSQHRVEMHSEVVSFSGDVALAGGGASLRLAAVLSRETEIGLSTFGGQLVWARALSLEIHVVVFDDLVLTRVDDPQTGLPVLDMRPAPALARPSPPAIELPPPSPRPAAAFRPAVAAMEAPRPAPAPAPAPGNEPHALPQKLYRQPAEELDAYPEVGDTVMHFHFGECTVIGSDGDRIKLRQDRDGRVREVALTMLRIEATTEETEGPRHFKLHRKN